MDRRPVQSREWSIFKKLAAFCATRKIKPNTISLFSMLGAVVASSAIIIAPHTTSSLQLGLCLVATILGVLFRLSCNLIDGMVAVEGKQRTPAGEIYNDVPDRISDVLVLAALGYLSPESVVSVALGWMVAVLSVMTAYIRMLGGSCKMKQDFGGPFAKQQRMLAAIILMFIYFIERIYNTSTIYATILLAVLAIGVALTFWLRACS